MSTTETGTLRIGVLKDTLPGETRVALIPEGAAALIKAGHTVILQAGAGTSAGHPDAEYEGKGAEIAPDAAAVLAAAEIVLSTRVATSESEGDAAVRSGLREGQVLIGLTDALANAESMKALADQGVRVFGLEMVPRISRAQSMDVLSSMATIAGYKAALLAANELPRVFPMVISAAGTLRPARVLVIGAGVAGLQAIATANRLGARVDGYDIRPTVKEQIESVGGTFVELDLPVEDAEDKGGYAKEKDESFYDRQREELGKVIAESNVVISTAAIPGRPAPLLITKKAVEGMAHGSVVIDLAASTGGNCEVTKVDEVIEHEGVRIFGPSNIVSTIPTHASQMFSKNVVTFLLHILGDSGLELDLEDPIITGSLLTDAGEVTHPRIRSILGLPERATPAEDAPDSGDADEGDADKGDAAPPAAAEASGPAETTQEG